MREGGNAFDAVVASMLAACVAEPVLASPGGGGFLTAKPNRSDPLVYDFFAQTPKRKLNSGETGFYPIEADFGTASQTFHIGMGSIATPGFIKGLYAIHRNHCRMPLQTLFQPAIELARNGIEINPFQHLITTIIAPILRATPEAFEINASPQHPESLISEGERHCQPALSAFLDILQHEGERLFYQGEAGRQLVDDCRDKGGHLQMEDLFDYRVEIRNPLQYSYRNAQLFTNPLPSLGGTLIAFSLGLLASHSLIRRDPGGEDGLRRLAQTMRLTQLVRNEHQLSMDRILNPEVSKHFSERLNKGGISTRGTTQISIADAEGNLASMTLSNGEGSGYVVPDTGIMMNNMLGEEDLNPTGFHQWPPNHRLASMMAPTLIVTDDGSSIVLGSGGSNRIRSAILQVIVNHLDYGMPLEQAVSFPRIHFENELLSLEPGIEPSIARALEDEFPRQQQWQNKNLFFGGTHCVMLDRKAIPSGIGDERRGGVCLSV
ncbi:MAG: gamma-glutamyltransferase [gamma proteobacterium symbiont of Ctena orbiculata]|nr:MAG: gamma-glutamyltransferase [gamma proteobacterium symbiont of Ctena orbiculata]PVV06708.1 MAG: gamma-glutamyltransferase [gamma proteobacterium symbiont of Ctena orbiculata]PVV12078.1 MAG: gamma-glutamyltransferase [gamma proteobacterium symbiont of Ctena orbiculata]PVV22552.1 MAG: gamma-glutamyltransferase [gamma proteobacterium symbiont of Ctena orbiculata]